MSPSTSRLSEGPRFACWFAAYLRGGTSLDDALDAITGDDAAHHIVGLDEGSATATPLALGLGPLRTAVLDRADHLALSLPAPGDPVGLAGPADFNADAVEAGAAVLLGGADLGLFPQRVGAGVFWQVRRAAAPAPPDLGEADRGLRAVLREVADTLAALDVAQWNPDIADALLNLRRAGGPHLPADMDPRAVAVATTATRCRTIVDLALQTDSAAVTGHEADSRAASLRPLDRAARRALAAACSAALPR